MTQYRIPAKSSKYYVERELYLTTVHFCRQYPTWLAELSVDPDSSKAITYDKERVQTSNQSDPTSDIAVRRADIARKVKLVENVAETVAASRTDAEWLILGVCYGLNAYQLYDRGMLLPRDRYYEMRKMFYYMMSQRL